MYDAVYLVAAIAAMIAIFYSTNRAVLAVRNPQRSGWLARGTGASNWLAVPCISAMILVIPFVGAGVYHVVPGVITGGILFLALVIASYLGVDRFMDMDQRLAACDAGRSPFKD
ncbi:MAG: hypothetical protein R3D67_13265 [Hyphomicrobiaceae bacterium]